MREKSVRTDLLLDFYGNLLTPKMRQGVHDTVKRAEKQLEEYEEKLGLLALFEKQQTKAKQALAHLNSGDTVKAARELEELIEEM